MTPISPSIIRPSKKDWLPGVYTGFMLGFGANIGLSAVNVAVGGQLLEPIKSGLFAVAFIALAAVYAIIFLHSNRGESA